MSKKLIVLLITLAMGLVWAQEPATSSTSTTVSRPAKRRLSQSATALPSIALEQENPSYLPLPPKKRFVRPSVPSMPQKQARPQEPEEPYLSLPAQKSGSVTPLEQEPEETLLPAKKRFIRSGISIPSAPQEQKLEASSSFVQNTLPVAPEVPTILAYFTPGCNFKDKLFPLLATAKKQLLISMFSITDQDIVNKIIEVKKRKVDVQIIFDENTLSQMARLLGILSAQNIQPIIYPSTITGSWMHNKFLVIDNKIVITGSANFTKKAFSNNPELSNYENIIIIKSDKTAQEYHNAFDRAKDEIFHLYVKTIKNNPNTFPAWFAHLIRKLYQETYSFGEMIRLQWKNYNQDEQTGIRQFFSWNLPTLLQQTELLSYHISPEGMSRGHAFNLIAKQREQKKILKRVREE